MSVVPVMSRGVDELRGRARKGVRVRVGWFTSIGVGGRESPEIPPVGRRVVLCAPDVPHFARIGVGALGG